MSYQPPRSLASFPALAPVPRAAERVELATKIIAVAADGDLLAALNSPLSLYLNELVCEDVHGFFAVGGENPQLLKAAEARMGADANLLPGLVALMLLQPSWICGNLPRLDKVPLLLLELYTRWRLAPPPVFERVGEALAYRLYLEHTIEEFHTAIAGPYPHPHAIGLNTVFHKYLSLNQTYFSAGAPARLHRQRADLAERLALAKGEPAQHFFGPRQPGKLRLGVIAAAYQATAEGYYIVSRLENLPRDEFEITLYYERDEPMPFQLLCFSLADHTVHIADPRQSMEGIERIRADDLDILLVGANVTSVLNSTSYAMIFRLARLQMEIGTSPTTTGFTACDVFLSAVLNEPETAQAGYTEELCLLPGMMNYYACQHDHEPATIAPARADIGVPVDAVLYASSSNYYKLVPEITTLWMRVLAAVPNSHLLLMPYGSAWGMFFPDRFMQRLHAECAAAGIDSARVLIQEPVPTRADIKALLKLADVYLDSSPFTGACSLVCPLEVRLPTVVMEGKAYRSRFAAGMMRFAGLDQFVATSDAEYLTIAIRLGQSRDALLSARAAMSEAFETGLPYFDNRHFPHQFAVGLIALWKRRQAVRADLAAWPEEQLRQEIATQTAALTDARNPFMQALGSDGLQRLLAEARDAPALAELLAYLDTFLPAVERRWTKLDLPVTPGLPPASCP